MGVSKTTAKVYVEKSTGVTFKDVAGQDEAKESLRRLLISFTILRDIQISEPSFLRGRFSWDLREQVRHSLPRQ